MARSHGRRTIIERRDSAEEDTKEDGSPRDRRDSAERRDSSAPPAFDGANHTTGIYGMSWCRKTGLIATGCKDGSVGLWRDRASFGVLLDGHNDGDADDGYWVRAVAWTADGRVLATGGMDGRIAIWAPDGANLFKFRMGSSSTLLETVDVSDDGEEHLSSFYVLSLAWIKPTLLVVGGADHVLGVWRVSYAERYPAARLVRVMRDHDDCVRCLATSPTAAVVASGSDDRTVRRHFLFFPFPFPGWPYLQVRVWGGGAGESDVAVHGFGGVVSAVCWEPGGALLAAASADSSVRVVNTTPGRQFGTLLWVWRGESEDVLTGVSIRGVRRCSAPFASRSRRSTRSTGRRTGTCWRSAARTRSSWSAETRGTSAT